MDLEQVNELKELFGLAGFLIVAGLVEVVKRAAPEWITDRWQASLALVLGLLWNVALGWRLGFDLWYAAILGIVAGLAASGLYSQQKTYRGQ